MLGDSYFVLVLCISTEEEHKEAEQESEQSSNIRQHIIDLSMSSFNLLYSNAFLNKHCHIAVRIDIDGIGLVPIDEVSFFFDKGFDWPDALVGFDSILSNLDNAPSSCIPREP